MKDVSDHQGVKGGRALWFGKKDKIFTVGFSKGSERQYALYDPRKLDQRLTLQVSYISFIIEFLKNEFSPCCEIASP